MHSQLKLGAVARLALRNLQLATLNQKPFEPSEALEVQKNNVVDLAFSIGRRCFPSTSLLVLLESTQQSHLDRKMCWIHDLASANRFGRTAPGGLRTLLETAQAGGTPLGSRWRPGAAAAPVGGCTVVPLAQAARGTSTRAALSPGSGHSPWPEDPERTSLICSSRTH